MNALQVNKFFWQHVGSERYVFELAELLRGRGNTSLACKLKTIPVTLGKRVYSLETRRKMVSLPNDSKVDVAHLHMISHQISPSILHALRGVCSLCLFAFDARGMVTRDP